MCRCAMRASLSVPAPGSVSDDLRPAGITEAAELRNEIKWLREVMEQQRKALLEAQTTLQFWMEHNREAEVPMMIAGLNTLQTMRVVKRALDPSQNAGDSRQGQRKKRACIVAKPSPAARSSAHRVVMPSCLHHPEPELGYSQWHFDAERREKLGQRQIWCNHCKSYVWETFWPKGTRSRVLPSRGAKAKHLETADAGASRHNAELTGGSASRPVTGSDDELPTI